MTTPQRGLDVIDVQVAQRLRMRRLQLGMEPRLLDLAISEPDGTVERIETGEKRIGAAPLFRLSLVLGVEINYFFSAEIDNNVQPSESTGAIDTRGLLEAQRFIELYNALDDPDLRAKIRALVAALTQPVRDR